MCSVPRERAFCRKRNLAKREINEHFWTRVNRTDEHLCGTADSRFKAPSLFATVSIEFLSSDSRRSRKFMTKWLRSWFSYTIARGSSIVTRLLCGKHCLCLSLSLSLDRNSWRNIITCICCKIDRCPVVRHELP